MNKLRKFIVKNYYGFGGIKLPWPLKNTVTGEYSLGWKYGSFFKGAPKVFLTFVLYGIMRIMFGEVEDFTWWWELPMLATAVMQLSWFTPFYGISYFDRHPLTDAERQELYNE